MDKALRYMTLARKAGRLAVGETGCGAAFASGKARLLLLASDASESTRKRAEKMLYGRRAPLRTLPWSRAELSELLGIEAEECTADGKFSLTACRCIGACGLAPVLTVNDEVYGRLTVADVPGILEKYKDA